MVAQNMQNKYINRLIFPAITPDLASFPTEEPLIRPRLMALYKCALIWFWFDLVRDFYRPDALPVVPGF